MGRGNASNEVAPTTSPRKKYLTKNEWLEAISILVMTATEDHLQRGAIMKLTGMLNMTCSTSTVYRLWECAECMCAMGILNLPELVSWEKILGEHLSI